MIVAEKELKIEGGYAPDLQMKMGEVNRQYILIPPFDISSYSVRSEIVKPDNTFVYTDQAINTDGNILLTLPEQAGAVAGYGHYIIKIYDLNTIVYSAVGVLRIDDHLILDGMIESIAEVNGYKFPDDFVIRGELGNIFDDTTVSNETGWTSQKISQEIGSAAVVFDDTQISNSLGWTSSKINSELLGMFDNTTTSNTKGWTSSKIESEIAGVLDDTTTSLNTGWSSSKIDTEIAGVLDDNTTSSTTGWSSSKIDAEITASVKPVSKTATGNNLSFSDGADSPVVRCTTEIQGSQSGTGTPSPYNIRPITAYSTGSIEVSDGDANTTTYTTTFPAAIYQGTEDVANGSVLCEKKMITISSGIQLYGNYGVDNAPLFYYDTISDISTYYNSSSPVENRPLSNCYNATTGLNEGLLGDFEFRTNANPGGSSNRFYFRDSRFTTAEEFNTWIANNPVDIVYTVYSPTTSSVTVSNAPVRTLSGYNEISSTTGNMTVEYITKTYEPIITALEH